MTTTSGAVKVDTELASNLAARRDTSHRLARVARALREWQPPLNRREFWAVQLLVLLIAGGHVLLEAIAHEIYTVISYVPTSLFLVPVVYAALTFGLHGSLPTALWSGLVTVPNLLIYHPGDERMSEIWQVGVVILVAVFVGQRVDREKRARQQAEERERARRTSEEKYRGIFDHVVEPILVLGPEYVVENANEAAAGLFGTPAAELKGRPVRELIDIDLDVVLAGNNESRVVQPLVVAGGRPKWVQPVLIPLVDAQGTQRTQLMLRDLTPEYERQHELEAYAKRTTEAREEERGRIARELHDGPVQSLVLLWRRLDAVGRLDDPAQEGELRAAQNAVREAAEELRRVSRDLRPSILDDLGLTSALRAEVSAFAHRSGIVARLASIGTERRLGPDRELALLRIVQEALRNIERHSRARRAMVRLHYEPSRLRLSVSDDGQGTVERTPSELVAGGRLGMIGMREQARLMDATLTVGPGRRHGTVITLTVPT